MATSWTSAVANLRFSMHLWPRTISDAHGSRMESTRAGAARAGDVCHVFPFLWLRVRSEIGHRGFRRVQQFADVAEAADMAPVDGVGSVASQSTKWPISTLMPSRRSATSAATRPNASLALARCSRLWLPVVVMVGPFHPAPPPSTCHGQRLPGSCRVSAFRCPPAHADEDSVYAVTYVFAKLPAIFGDEFRNSYWCRQKGSDGDGLPSRICDRQLPWRTTGQERDASGRIPPRTQRFVTHGSSALQTRTKHMPMNPRKPDNVTVEIGIIHKDAGLHPGESWSACRTRAAVRAGCRGASAASLRATGGRSVPPVRHGHLSRRHLHAPPGLRPGAGLHRVRPHRSAVDDARRGLRTGGGA